MSKKVEKKVATPVKKEAAKEAAKVAEKSTKKDEKVDMVNVNVKLNELRGLVDFALHARFFLMTLLPTPKKGSRVEKILKGVENAGPLICNIGERLGMKFGDEPKNGSYKKNDCKCNDCKCHKEAVENKPVEKKVDVKKTDKKPSVKSVKKQAKK